MSESDGTAGDGRQSAPTKVADPVNGAGTVRPTRTTTFLPSAIRRSPELVELLERHSTTIQQDWARALRNLRRSHYAGLPLENLETWTGRGLSAIIRSLRTGSPAPIESHARAVSRVRHLLGFDIAEVSVGLLQFKRIVFPLLIREIDRPAEVEDLYSRLDICICLLISRFARLYAETSQRLLERARSRMALLLESIEAAVGSLDPDRVLSEVAEVLGRAIEASYCVVLRATETTGRFQIGAMTAGSTCSILDALAEHPLEIGEAPLVGDVTRAHGPVRYRSGDGKPIVGRADCRRLDVAALLAVPIVAAGEVLAIVLAVSTDDETAFGARRRRLAQGIASAVAPAVDHARLYAESRRNLAESRMRQRLTGALLSGRGTAKVLELSCREARELLGARGCAILLRREEGEGLEVVHAGGEAIAETDKVLETLARAHGNDIPVEPVLLDDLLVDELACSPPPGISSLLIVPLHVHGRTVGALQLVNKDGGFDDDDRRAACVVSEQVAVAIEHARLHEQQERVAVLEERQRLARDLHDSVTQSIYGVTTFAEAAARLLEAGDVSGAGGRIEELRAAAQNTLREMRLLIFELHPVDLEREGLVSVLRARLAAVEGRAGLRTEFHCEGVHDLPRTVEDGLFRITQEALNNSLKHAEASQIVLTLEQRDSGVRLTFADNGVGFNLRTGKMKGGLGLRGIEARVLQLDGRISIDTRPGSGTKLTVDIPLRAERNHTTAPPRGE